MFPGVSGLVNVTVICEELPDRTASSPTFFHDMTGLGIPDALQVSPKILPSTAMFVFEEISTDDATTLQRKIQ